MRTSFLSQLLLFAFFIIASCNENPKGVNNNKRDDNTNKNRNDNRDDNRDDNNNRDDENRYDSRFSLKGSWRITDSNDEMEETYKDNITVESSTIEFTRDGSLIRTDKYILSGEKKETKRYGTYKFNERTKILLILFESDEDEEIADVEFLGKNKLIITSKGEKMTLVRN